MSRRLRQLADIARWRLCVGCGVCTYICPEDNVRLCDVVGEGIRPIVLDTHKCGTCTECLQACPAYELDHRELSRRPGLISELTDLCGPVLEIWEGHASDPELRFSGASGGLLTALALFCLEQRGMHGVLHIGPDEAAPLRNRTFLSRTRADLLARAGSRYAPASACDRLRWIEEAPAPCVFIGQPGEVAGLRKAQQRRPLLQHRIGLVLSFFCAGSPATLGTLELLRQRGVDPESVRQLRYRGHGWPGLFSALLQNQTAPACEMTYEESWAFLQKYRPYSAHLWPDGSGEAADISCGDAWHTKPQPGQPGNSLLLVRTELGRDMVRQAVRQGYLTLNASQPSPVLEAQRGLFHKRQTLWGRRAAFRLCGLPLTHLPGFPLFALWLKLPWGERLRSICGTLRRIVQRHYYRPLGGESPSPKPHL